MKKADLIKKIIKSNVGEKPTFGTDPNDPWSAKANITETALLNRYLKSRGINPEFATKDPFKEYYAQADKAAKSGGLGPVKKAK